MEKTLLVVEMVMPEETYWALVDLDTGEKIAPWADADTAEQVMENLRRGSN